MVLFAPLKQMWYALQSIQIQMPVSTYQDLIDSLSMLDVEVTSQ